MLRREGEVFLLGTAIGILEMDAAAEPGRDVSAGLCIKGRAGSSIPR
jgi:hypothetical protein